MRKYKGCCVNCGVVRELRVENNAILPTQCKECFSRMFEFFTPKDSKKYRVGTNIRTPIRIILKGLVKGN